MHVVVVPSWYSSDENIVLGSFFKEQALALKESGIDITVCYNEILPIYRYKKFINIFNSRIEYSLDDGLDTYRYTDFNYLLHYHKRFLLFQKRIEKLLNKVIIEKGRIDIIHFHSCFWAGVAVPYIKNVFNVPCIITEHTSMNNSKKMKKSYIKYINRAYEDADVLISVSSSLKNEICKMTSRDVIVLHNFIDGTVFNVKLNQNDKIKFTFFSLGFLVDGKGFELLIGACEILVSKGYDFILEIGGDGYLNEKLRKMVSYKKLDNNVKFLGLLSRQEVVLRMNKCDSFILASCYETFGVVYIEALACGKPIISVKNGGVEDIIDEKVGVLVDKYNCIEVSNSMEFMINNIEKYDSRCIRDYFLEKFEKQVIIARLKDVYRDCLAI